MRTAREHSRLAKGALAGAVVLGGVLGWQVYGVWAGSGTVEHAPRLLIVLATSGGDRPYEIHADVRVDDLDGDLSFVFYGQGDGLADEWAYVPIDVQVTFASSGIDAPITCGPDGEHAAGAGFDELSAGAKWAVQVDLVSDRRSALNYREDDGVTVDTAAGDGDGGPQPPGENPADDVPAPESADYQVFSSTLALLTENNSTTSRWFDGESGVVWAEQCTIPRDYVWRSSKNSLYELAARETFLMPQVNVVAQAGDDLVHQTGLVADTSVARESGRDVLTSYPPFTVGYEGWFTTVTAQRSGTKLLFTEQPVLILENRDAAQRKELVLLLYGVAAGAAGSLLVAAVSHLTAARAAAARERERPTAAAPG
ncbi:hypothetical protein E1212_20185 [Jiangella ureilytica]|uniref:Uncharacterized protein n=1 Tax=Jiangella ureilytica TaxID=2530374 RepID=A0A4R4RHQ7_9ACTN|nr:hypothetical protein [Jiangella ureilytica]TDC48806.1 hypothetical protein E1212_20185 [Jiangella ureilytica]